MIKVRVSLTNPVIIGYKITFALHCIKKPKCLIKMSSQG